MMKRSKRAQQTSDDVNMSSVSKKIKEEMLQNMSLYFWKGRCFEQISTFLLASLRTPAVFPFLICRTFNIII